MGINNRGYAQCTHCGAEFRLFTIFNRDMQSLCKIWRRRHEQGCAQRTPEKRRAWAKKYVGKDQWESSIVVDLDHTGFLMTSDEQSASEVTANVARNP